jgi:hypothetical protein
MRLTTLGVWKRATSLVWLTCAQSRGTLLASAFFSSIRYSTQLLTYVEQEKFNKRHFIFYTFV